MMGRIILSSFGATSRRAAAAGHGILSSASIAMLLSSVLALATSSCSGAGSSIVGSTTQDVQSFQATAGNDQVGTAGSDLPTPITVRALAKGGQGVSGISVQWTFSGGGGSLTPGGTVSQSLTTVTDKQGNSSVYWQLDTIAGDQTATATLSGASSNSTTSVKFHSHGKAGGPATLVVSPKGDTLAVGDSAQFTATVLDRWKNVISGATVTWSSSNDSVLTVSSTGMARALRSGSATVIATTSASSTSAAGSSSISGGASVSVEPSTASTAQTATISVTPTSLFFTSLNATAQLSAVAKDSTGNTVTSPGFTWKSLATSIATVSATGLVTAKAVGATTIIVTAACCGSKSVRVGVDTASSQVPQAPAVGSPNIVFDTRAGGAQSIQASGITAVSAANSTIGGGVQSVNGAGYTVYPTDFVTNYDGRGTHAYRFNWTYHGGYTGSGCNNSNGEQDANVHFQNGVTTPAPLYVQWKVWYGRTSSGGGYGNSVVGSFDHSGPGGGHKLLIVYRDANGTTAYRLMFAYNGANGLSAAISPSPESGKIEWTQATGATSGTITGYLNGAPVNLNDYINQVVTFTLKLVPESSPGAGDGEWSAWLNGEQVWALTNLPMGSEGFYIQQFGGPTWICPPADQTQYQWDWVEWKN